MKSSYRGFTLIELIVAMAVLGILAAVAAPAIGEYLATQRLKGAAEELQTDLQFARMESVQRNSAITVSLSSTGYTIAQGANTIKSVALGSGSTITGGATMVATFNQVRATADINIDPANVTVSNTATSRTLRVSLTTMGRVSICSPSGAVKGYDTCPS
jgi:type IV fimbrial biogenesis protein FimT